MNLLCAGNSRERPVKMALDSSRQPIFWKKPQCGMTWARGESQFSAGEKECRSESQNIVFQWEVFWPAVFFPSFWEERSVKFPIGNFGGKRSANAASGPPASLFRSLSRAPFAQRDFWGVKRGNAGKCVYQALDSTDFLFIVSA